MNIREIRKKLNLTQGEFAKQCGVSLRTVQNWENGQNIPESTIRLIEKINVECETVSPFPAYEEVATVTGDVGTIVPASVVEEAKAEAIEEYKAEESVPFLATDLVTATINVRKYVEKNADELDQIDPSKLLNNPDVAEMITGTSMLPTFAPNDIVFIKFLPDRSQLIDGKMYYFDLDNLPTMIRKVKFEEGDKLRLIAKNPAFADIIINRTNILNIGKVVGMFRQTFGDQYDEIDVIRRQKDTTIERLIEQQGEMLKQNSEQFKAFTSLIEKMGK